MIFDIEAYITIYESVLYFVYFINNICCTYVIY